MGGAAFLGGLLGGFGEGMSAGISERRERKQALSDEERKQKEAWYSQAHEGLQNRLAAMDQNDPKRAELEQQQGQIRQDWINLYHPDQGSAAMQELGRKALQYAHNFPAELEHVGRMVWHHHGPESAAGAPGAAAPAATNVPAGTGITTPELPGRGEGRSLAGEAAPQINAVAEPMTPATTLPAMTNIAATLPGMAASQVSRRAARPQDAARDRQARLSAALAAGAVQPNVFTQTKNELRQAFPNATDEQLEDWTMTMAGGLPRTSAAARGSTHWSKYGKAYKDETTGKFTQDFVNPAGEFMSKPITQALGEEMTTSPQAKTELERFVQAWFPKGATVQQREWAMNRFWQNRNPEATGWHEQAIGPDAQGKYKIVRMYTQQHVPGGEEGDPWGGIGPPPPNRDGTSAVPPGYEGGAAATPAPTAGFAPGRAPTGGSGQTPLEFQQRLNLLRPNAAPQGGGGGAAPAAPAAAGVQPAFGGVPGVAAAPSPGAGPAARRGAAIPSPEERMSGIRKPTPAEERAMGTALTDVTNGQKLYSMGQEALNAPERNDAERIQKASLQRGFVGVLQYTLEHRYNQQAREQLVGQYGIGGNVQTWIYQKFGNGMIPPDIFRGLIAIASSNLAGAQKAVDSLQKTVGAGGDTGAGGPAKSQQEQDDENFLRQVH